MSDEDRELPATPRRREEAAAAGMVARSSEVTAAALFLAGVGLVWLGGTWACETLAAMLRRALSAPPAEAANLLASTQQSLITVALWTAGAVALCGLAAVAAELMQVGWRPNPARLTWNLERIAPWNGLARLCQAGLLLRGLGALAKLMLLAWLAWQAFVSATPGWETLAARAPGEVAMVLALFAIRLAGTLGLACLAFAAWDYLLAWRKLEHDLQMSAEEVRAEADSGPRRRRPKRAATQAAASPEGLVATPKV